VSQCVHFAAYRSEGVPFPGVVRSWRPLGIGGSSDNHFLCIPRPASAPRPTFLAGIGARAPCHVRCIGYISQVIVRPASFNSPAPIARPPPPGAQGRGAAPLREPLRHGNIYLLKTSIRQSIRASPPSTLPTRTYRKPPPPASKHFHQLIQKQAPIPSTGRLRLKTPVCPNRRRPTPKNPLSTNSVYPHS
jgi:hypothetical protein